MERSSQVAKAYRKAWAHDLRRTSSVLQPPLPQGLATLATSRTQTPLSLPQWKRASALRHRTSIQTIRSSRNATNIRSPLASVLRGEGAGVRGFAGCVNCQDIIQQNKPDLRARLLDQVRFPPTDNRTLAKAREPPGQARWGWDRSTQTPLSLPQWIRAFALRS